ncbi:MAG: hypothetical protein A2879_05475 [Omnitrophica WOR_2 bacterium RIFCSPHIGHO2_01_FULL_49_10]|nr:MAG: hypothetical protein A2879_05475 [Omnitrophica WOR_2 bacterium RIFCSPHIGHO2_01_FULL_49_10]OGX34865.1 MAG: hypothetical protein A3I43_03585 [Omnitrophica WOR_2 bacterium RIFCSPLOWO2_02_FULL_50_19]
MKENDVCNVIAEALGRRAGSVSVDDGTNTIKEWDSLGFLSILSALEKRFGTKVAAIDDLATVRSVREIIDIFKREGII